MSSRKVIDLVPELQPLAMLFATKMAEAGIPWMITRTRCTQQEQNELYAQGRTKLGPIVTWTLNSMHIYGKAFDIALLLDGRPTWDPKVDVDDDGIYDYIEAGQIGESIGLVWGGRWKKPDYPHFQLVADYKEG